MGYQPKTQVKFTNWDSARRTEDEIEICKLLSPSIGEVVRQTHEHAYVINWLNANFTLGSERATGNLLSEHWDSEFQECDQNNQEKDSDDSNDSKDHTDNQQSESQRDENSEQDSSERESEESESEGMEESDDNKSEDEKDPYDFGPIKFNPETSKNRQPGEKLEAPENYGNEFTGPIILTNHPEKWQTYKLPDGATWRWNGEVWVDVDSEDEVPKDESEREKFFNDCPDQKNKWGQKYADVTLPLPAPTQAEIERREKFEFVQRRGYKLNNDKTSFTDSDGKIKSAERVKGEYNRYKNQKIVYERLRCIISNQWAKGSDAAKALDLYRWFRDKDFWTNAQADFAKAITNKFDTQIKQVMGDSYRKLD